jgi:hypothetical protein
MSEITAASHEQQSGIEQVNQAIIQMDQVTQQNAALVEQAAAASAAMKSRPEIWRAWSACSSWMRHKAPSALLLQHRALPPRRQYRVTPVRVSHNR